ncbi:GntR family transcriptional regulator [Mesorhizobium sp. RP14(2022)]|uniref:GntR family transcriptional regulator n=1 Tax=Mesorhizobium liriopis TaxID=2953882 RepID=A0ABT1C283_9HYPH|nr:GntR family transcriptional regulator [Mesorhizobium liriopis]MCO6048925.1 GntR family transcriptional regulator [Mesorhizobium liriopis]
MSGVAAILDRMRGDDHLHAPLYMRLQRAIEEALASGSMAPGEALPSERDLANLTDVSRVTVRKAVRDLVERGVLVQRQGSGTFVAPRVERVEQQLSRLTSFSEDMARRGLTSRSVWLDRGVYPALPSEVMALGLRGDEKVARLSRLRIAGDTPLAIERAVISATILPAPRDVLSSLYAVLDQTGHRPVRAVQRIAAVNLGEEDARLLGVVTGSASLSIERISYLASGRAIELTRSIYRGDAYDFVAELSWGAPREGIK